MLEMLDEHGPVLPHAWVAGDDELGRSSWFRQELRARNESYLLAVPSNTLVRDLTVPDPPATGRGRRRQVPFTRVDRWCAAVPESAWQTIDVRDGEKGPLVTQGLRRLVQAGGVSRAPGGWRLEARLSVVVCSVGNPAWGICPSVQGPAPHRRILETGQGRGGPGGLSGADVGRMASSSNVVVDRDLVPHAGDQAGKKSRPPR